MMSTETHSSEKDRNRPDLSRPLVTSKCLSNLRSIVSHNVSMNNHNQHDAVEDKNNPAHTPVALRPAPARLMELALLPVNSSNGINLENHRRKPRQSFPTANTHVEYSENEVVRNSLSPSKKRVHGNHQNPTLPNDTSSISTLSQVHHGESAPLACVSVSSMRTFLNSRKGLSHGISVLLLCIRSFLSQPRKIP